MRYMWHACAALFPSSRNDQTRAGLDALDARCETYDDKPSSIVKTKRVVRHANNNGYITHITYVTYYTCSTHSSSRVKVWNACASTSSSQVYLSLLRSRIRIHLATGRRRCRHRHLFMCLCTGSSSSSCMSSSSSRQNTHILPRAHDCSPIRHLRRCKQPSPPQTPPKKAKQTEKCVMETKRPKDTSFSLSARLVVSK